MPLLMKFAAVLEKLAIRRHETGANGQAVIKGVLFVPKRIEPCHRSSFEIRHRQNIAEIRRTEKRPVGDEAMGVEFASLPAHKLFQIDVERRLKNPDSDSARSDSTMNIRQKVVGIIEGKSDAMAIEIRPQSPPIAGQVGLGDFARFARPLHLRQGRRSKIIGC
jgi:hypothetical protein